MKIMYDSQLFLEQKYGGATRYFCELIKLLKKEHKVIVPVLFSVNYYLNIEMNKKMYNISGNTLKFVKLINQIYNIIVLVLWRPDILHVTNYKTYLNKFLPKKTKLIVTAHDMIHEIFPEMYPINEKTTSRKKVMFNNADKIIAISESTKEDLLFYFGDDLQSKIDIVYHGSPFQLIQEGESLGGEPNSKQYILFVGERHCYKNFFFFLTNISKFLKENNLKLVCFGGGSFKNEELELIESLSLTDLIEQHSVTENDLMLGYNQALCFVYPSLYEGFGIPILESWSMNCPVVLSDTKCFREVAGDAAEYFNPTSKESVYDAIEKVIKNAEYRYGLVDLGRSRVQEFTLQKTFEFTLQIYDDVLRGTSV